MMNDQPFWNRVSYYLPRDLTIDPPSLQYQNLLLSTSNLQADKAQPDHWPKTTGSAIELLASMSPLFDIKSLSYLLYLKLIDMAGQFSKPSFCALTWSPVVFSYIDSSQPVVRTSLLDATLTTTRWVLNVLLTQNCNYLLFRWSAQRW